MGRHCCCGAPTDCDLNNCPLCSCVEGIPEEIKLKDFKTAKYKLSGFKNINYNETFGGQGGTGVYVNFDHEKQAPVDDYRHIPFNGQLNQTYKLRVTGFEVLNGKDIKDIPVLEKEREDNICQYSGLPSLLTYIENQTHERNKV